MESANLNLENNLENETASVNGTDIKTSFTSKKPTPIIHFFSNLKFDIVFVAGTVLGFLALSAFIMLKPDNESGGIFSPLSRNAEDNVVVSEDLFENPLTGELVPVDQAASWSEIRPLGAMINNHVSARPQSGLVDADVVYEIVAEGGITRFLAFFLSDTPEKIGPIRSTRHYYLVVVKELGDAMLMHIGWSPQALEAIETWPVRSLGRGGAQFWRDQDRINNGVATEHTAYVNGTELRELGNTLGWEGKSDTFTSWKFKEEAPISAVANSTGDSSVVVGLDKPISIDFWYEGDYSAIWNYSVIDNSYLRSMGYDDAGNPIPHKDQETGEQIEVKNVVVQFVLESSIQGDDKNRLDYELVGSGEGLVFLDGTVKTVTWAKADRDSRTMFYDANGNELEFNRGKVWVSIVPERNKDQVTY